ncbi:glycosyltransferase [Pelagibacterales bacterium SAG-MED15]|nr:glycosyltransferase [Pelagibacterales bacterium SAG-MED15]
MNFTILVPTFNNFEYLKLFCKSIHENSTFNHQLIFHVNDGSDGSYDFIKQRYQFTYSKENIGLCSSINEASRLIKNNYVIYAHDDMFFCKDWDNHLLNSINEETDNMFYFSGTNISYKDGIINYDCGNGPDSFDRAKFDLFCKNDQSNDLQGSHWAPHVIHKDLWDRVGGFSLEFDPGDGSDPDLCMKLWKEGVRKFKCISKFKVYHFGSVTTRKGNIFINNGTKKFLLKYGFNPRFFRKYYLQGDGKNSYKGPLNKPEFTFNMIIDLLINKLKFYYYKLLQ